MTLLENQANINENQDKEKIIVVQSNEQKEISLKKSIILSIILHPLSVFILWLSFVLLLFLNPNLFNKPEIKQKKDIEFTLVTRPGEPINKNTKNRSDMNSRAGGKHDPNRKESEPRPQAIQTQMSVPKTTSSASAPKQQQRPSVSQQTPKNSNPIKENRTVTKPEKKVQKTPPPRPNKIVTQPKPKPNVNNKFAIEVPKVNSKTVNGPLSGPIPSSVGKTKGSNTGRSNIGPILAPSSNAGSGGGSKAATQGGGGRSAPSVGSYGSSGNAGNPSPGNPKGAPGIDAIREPDFGPYMKEIERRIKANWSPPNSSQSKKVVLLFKVARDGRLLSLKVAKSSGYKADDDAAIAAVKLTAPFRPLPPEFKGDSVDINFTFDFYASSARRY